LTKSRTVSKTNGASSFAISSLKPSAIYLRIVFYRWLYAVYTTIARAIVTIADNFGVKFSAGAYPLLSVSNPNTAIPLMMALLYSESPNSWSNMVIQNSKHRSSMVCFRLSFTSSLALLPLSYLSSSSSSSSSSTISCAAALIRCKYLYWFAVNVYFGRLFFSHWLVL